MICGVFFSGGDAGRPAVFGGGGGAAAMFGRLALRNAAVAHGGAAADQGQGALALFATSQALW